MLRLVAGPFVGWLLLGRASALSTIVDVSQEGFVVPRKVEELHHYVIYNLPKVEEERADQDIHQTSGSRRPHFPFFRRDDKLKLEIKKSIELYNSIMSEYSPDKWDENIMKTFDRLPMSEPFMLLLPKDDFRMSRITNEFRIVLQTSIYAYPSQPKELLPVMGEFLDPLEEGECFLLQTLSLYKSRDRPEPANDIRKETIYKGKIVKDNQMIVVESRMSDCSGFLLEKDEKGDVIFTITSTKAADGNGPDKIIRRGSHRISIVGATNENVVQKSLSRSNSNGASRSSRSRSQRKSSTLDQ